nr:hypothetical protein [Tanacetum cinerariifolium]
MVVILEKGEHNTDFHPMVDFLEASPLSPRFSGRVVPLFDAMLVPQDMNEGEETTERISDDTEEMATVLTSMDAATVLSGGIDDVPTGSGSIPTAGPPAANIPTGNFIPMGSKEEAKRYKRKGIRFDQESSKKLKSLEEVIVEAKSTDEILEEKIKEMMQLKPIEEVYVEAL